MHALPSLACVFLSALSPAVLSPFSYASDDLPLIQAQPEPLNVVLIVLDDVGHDLVGAYSRNYACAGCPAGTVPDPCTPNLDALAARGTRFTNAWSSPWCSPTRAQVMTGKQVSQLGVGFVTLPGTSRPGLDPNETTIADLFPISAAVGKWHLAEDGLNWGHPLECGFQSYSGTMWNLNPRPEDGPEYTEWRNYDGINDPVIRYDYATTATTDKACEHLQTLNTTQAPWLLYVSYNAIHVPFHCPPNPPPPGSSPCTLDWWNECNQGNGWSASTHKAYAMMQALDYEVGRLLQSIDQTTTAVFVLGDNGTPGHVKNPPFIRGTKGTMYQGGLNVPMIATVPGMPGGNEVHELVHVSDLFATLADLALLPIPSETKNLDSVSMAQYLNPDYADPTDAPRKFLYSEAFRPNYHAISGAPPAEFKANYHYRALRNERYKLIERVRPTGVTHELFALFSTSSGAPSPPHDPAFTDDPHELNDLIPSQSTWGPEVQSAYTSLVNELALNHPALPIKK